MMPDKKTLLVLVGCVLALMGWQFIVNKIYPPKPLPPPATQSNAVTTAAVARVTAPATNIVEQPTPAPAVVEPAQPRPPEEMVLLENEFVRMQFTSWGGGIRLVELRKHKSNGAGNVILNETNAVPALALKEIPGAGPEGTYELTRPEPATVVMRTKTTAGIVVTKRFTLGDNYLGEGSIEIVPPGGTPIPAAAEVVIGTATPAGPQEGDAYLGLDWLVGTKHQNRGQKHAAKGAIHEVADARWAAVKSQFFTMLLTPATNAVAVRGAQLELPVPAGWKAKNPPHGLTGSVELRPSVTTADGAVTYAFTFYAGPKDYDRLTALKAGQEEVMQFGMWGFISVILLKSMKWSYKLIPNYGVAIILITIVIKILFWPLLAKQMKAMKEMQKFQPLMQKLREKYKDDPQRLNQEMMKLYKEHKVNPFAGCLPMLPQIPVFFGLFAMLRSAIELRGAAFLWIQDLSRPDTIFNLPGVGWPVNPLPLLMVGSMIWQQKITPTTGDPQQAKMMMFMPLMMLLFFYNASSGLALYWTVQQLLSIAQQYWTMRQSGPSAPAGQLAGTGKAS